MKNLLLGLCVSAIVLSACSQGLVQSVNVSDFAFLDEEEAGPFAIGSYEGMQTCENSVFLPRMEDNLVNLRSDSYAFAKTTASNVDGELSAKWFFEEKHRPLDANGEEDLSADFIHDGWKEMHTETGLEISESCDGDFYIVSKIPAEVLGKYFYDEGPLGTGGTFRLIFYLNGKELAMQDFSGLLSAP